MTRVVIVLAVVPATACFYDPTGSAPVQILDTQTGGSSTSNVSTVEPLNSGTTGASSSSTATSLSSGSTATTNATAYCGDGILEDPEECDDGNLVETDECLKTCKLAECGDGVVGLGEVCDDGAETGNCDVDCTFPECGDGLLNVSAGEACDDNKAEGGACSPTCTQTRIVALALGYHTCVLLETGAIRCWGLANFGQLGSGQNDHLGSLLGDLPVVDVDVGGTAVAIAAGGYHTCALLDTGKVRCWGFNMSGQLGYGHTVGLGDQPGEMPTGDVNAGTIVLQIALGEHHSCARVVGGKVRCWGHGDAGQLGYGSTVILGDGPGEMPTTDLPTIGNATDLSLGTHHGFAVLKDGQEVRGWGMNNYGQIGLGHTKNIGDEPGIGDSPTLVNVGVVTNIAASRYHSCAVVQGGMVRCWGKGTEGQLGYGNIEHLGDSPGEMPPPNVDVGGVASKVVVGEAHSCALLITGKVKCWGSGLFGALGAGNTYNRGDGPGEMPPPDVDLGGDAVTIASHIGGFTCAILEDDSLRCWGFNGHGQLGYGHTNHIGDDELPVSAGAVPF